jgi:hypothetical protein
MDCTYEHICRNKLLQLLLSKVFNFINRLHDKIELMSQFGIIIGIDQIIDIIYIIILKYLKAD